MLTFLKFLNQIVWGVPALLLILGVGIYLTIRTHFAQFRFFPQAMRSFLKQFFARKESSTFRALCTALGATVGTGNLAGVAGAIALGGPGAIFWMWICGLLGMVTKFAEATLAICYRRKNRNGEYIGGPMQMIEQGMGKRWRWLASLYCFFAVVASFGVGNATQINAVIGGINSVIYFFGGRETLFQNVLMSLVLSAVVCGILFGGAKRIGEFAEKLVPFASIAYLLLGFTVLIGRYQAIPNAISMIVQGAFSPQAVTGGMIGSMLTSVRIGASRGVFTNEAGMGTASIAHAGAKVEHPVQQGLMGIMEVFLDTIVICTMTALVILCSGVPISYGFDNGIYLTTQAFSAVLGDWVCIPIALALCCFAVATVLGWGLYGARSAQYLFGKNAWKKFVYAQGVTVVVGSLVGTGTVWMLSETVNGLMAIPNLIALIVLTPKLVSVVEEYRNLFYNPRKNGKTKVMRNLTKHTVKW